MLFCCTCLSQQKETIVAGIRIIRIQLYLPPIEWPHHRIQAATRAGQAAKMRRLVIVSPARTKEEGGNMTESHQVSSVYE